MAYMSKLDVLIKGENGAPDITEEYDLAALRLVDAATRDPLDIGDEATPVYFANGVPRECVIGEGGGGSVVSITPNYTGGNLVARYTIDGKSGSLYSPKVGSAYTRTQLWEGNGAGLSNVGDNNDSAPFSSSLGNYSFLLIHYAPSNNINEERVMMVDAKVISDLIGSQNAYISCHYLSDVFIKCKFNTQTTIEVVESRSLPLPNDQTLKCVIKKIEGITFGVSGEDLAQGLNVIKALWSGTADTVGDTRNFVRDAIIDDYNFIYVHYYEESNPYDEKILILDEMAIRNGLAPVGSEDPSQSYFTCYITDNLYIKGLFTTASQFTIVEVSDDDNKHCIINRIDGVSLGASNAGGGSSSDCMKKGVDYVTIAEGAAPVPPYTDPVLGLLTNIWGEGNAISGKTMTFAAKDTGIGFADYGSGFDLSQYTYITFTLTEFPSFAEYGQIVVNDVEDNKATFAFEDNVAIIDLSEIEGNVKQLYFQCGGVGDVTIESITFSTEPLAISSVNPDFAVVDGMVYSAGEITVYNVAGKLIATASQAFDVNSLQAGVYFIVAQEGTIKFVK